MFRDPDKAVQAQRQYYADTAEQYDSMHAREAGDDHANMKIICGLMRILDARTVLDVGAGTGRGLRHLRENLPDLHVRGIEPVPSLIQQAVQKNGIPQGTIIQGVGEALPFEDASFDVACSFGILHHIANPEVVIREMLRVASAAVIISDGNRFGQGTWPTRLLKLFLFKLGLWRIVNYLKTRGKGYLLTEGDGVAYSYSVYDSLACITEWADRVVLIPGEPGKVKSWFHPLLTAGTIIVCAMKENTPR